MSTTSSTRFQNVTIMPPRPIDEEQGSPKKQKTNDSERLDPEAFTAGKQQLLGNNALFGVKGYKVLHTLLLLMSEDEKVARQQASKFFMPADLVMICREKARQNPTDPSCLHSNDITEVLNEVYEKEVIELERPLPMCFQINDNTHRDGESYYLEYKICKEEEQPKHIDAADPQELIEQTRMALDEFSCELDPECVYKIRWLHATLATFMTPEKVASWYDCIHDNVPNEVVLKATRLMLIYPMDLIRRVFVITGLTEKSDAIVANAQKSVPEDWCTPVAHPHISVYRDDIVPDKLSECTLDKVIFDESLCEEMQAGLVKALSSSMETEE